MKRVLLNLPTVGAAVATRAALAAGLGLVLADRIPLQRRRRIGATLIAIGVVTTIPLLRALLNGRRRADAIPEV